MLTALGISDSIAQTTAMTAAVPGPEDRSDSDTSVPCRALVGGFGRPGQRDLDFGRQLVD